MTLKKSISSIFDKYGIKIVSKTDKSKGAYILNKQQVGVLKAAGVKPSSSRPYNSFKIHLLGDPDTKVISATYYHSTRKGSGRTGEPRLGTEIISQWLNAGDELLLATDNSKIYALKLNENSYIDATTETIKSKVISELTDDFVIKRAKSAPRKALKEKRTTEVYYRDPYVIEAAKRRAKGKCEMPRCTYKAFFTENGKPYLEGHHVKPLAENGNDTINNVAALCPQCHREQHYSKDKLDKRKTLLQKLKKIIKK